MLEKKGKLNLFSSPNSTFLTIYHHHVVQRWRANYFSYDGLRSMYKEVKKGSEGTTVTMLELAFDMEIKRVRDFVDSCLSNFENTMDDLKDEVDDLIAAKTEYEEEKLQSAGQRGKKDKEEEDDDELFGEEKIIDGLIREVYKECNDMSSFLELNLFAIAKMAKKFRKVCCQPPHQCRTEDGVDVWTNFPSYSSYCELAEREKCIKDVLKRIEEVYCTAFRTTYPELAQAELHFDKDKHQQLKRNLAGLGVKLGMILAMVAFLVLFAADNQRTNSARIFTEPSLLIYTTIGNVLLFRLLWSANAWLWKENHINYSHLLNLGITQPNALRLLEETSTFFLLYCIILVIYLELEVVHPGKAIHNVCPLLLLFTTASFAIKNYMSILKQKGKFREASGSLFDYGTLLRCFSTPFIGVTFRDTFAADVLTSFTKPMSDAVYASCWLISGSFLRNDGPGVGFGSSSINCRGYAVTQLANVYIVGIPFLIRFLQCCRDGYDKKTWHPQVLNATKYLSAMVFILYAISRDSRSGIYYFLVVFTSVYKWLWDVIMDWDLFETDTCDRPLLRSDLLYSPSAQYYVAIVADLVLRFVWVVSLAPSGTPISILKTSQFNFFFGSLEISRRFIWSHFRMEYEHLKHVKKNAIGYIERRRFKTKKSFVAKSKRSLINRTKIILENSDKGENGFEDVTGSYSKPSEKRFPDSPDGRVNMGKIIPLSSDARNDDAEETKELNGRNE